LHVNPTVFGSVYEEHDIVPLVDILRRHNITVVEDLAYALIQLQSQKRLHSFLPHLPDSTCVLLGLSKPFAIANVRAGVLVARPQIIDSVTHRVSISVGHVSSMIQGALLAMVEAPVDSMKRFLQHNAFNGIDGYVLKRDVMIACFEGTSSTDKIGEQRKPIIQKVLMKQLREFLASQYAETVSTDAGTQAVTVPGTTPHQHFTKWWARRVRTGLPDDDMLVNVFCKTGLNRYFEVTFVPDAGFFLIVDSKKLIAQSQGHSWAMNSSMDVFFFLRTIFDVRLIPEEVMGDFNEIGKKTCLRFTFSPTMRRIVWGLFTLFVGLHALEELPLVS